MSLPDAELHTTALWWQLEQAALEKSFQRRQDALDGFLGAAYALHTVASVSVMAEARDLHKAVGSGDAAYFATQDNKGRGQWRACDGKPVDPDAVQGFAPTVYLYDSYPGGIGLSEPLFRRAPDLVRDARALISACACAVGCPACVGPVLASDEDTARSAKALAQTVLDCLT